MMTAHKATYLPTYLPDFTQLLKGPLPTGEELLVLPLHLHVEIEVACKPNMTAQE